MTYYLCRDCEKAQAVMFLPEGRYLCKPCYKALMALRNEVLKNNQERREAKKQVYGG